MQLQNTNPTQSSLPLKPIKQFYNNNINNSNNIGKKSKSKNKHYLLRSKQTNSIFSSGATLVEEEDFNELTAVPTPTILIATNPNPIATAQGRIVPARPDTVRRTSTSITIAAPTKNVLQRQQATQQHTSPFKALAQSIEEDETDRGTTEHTINQSDSIDKEKDNITELTPLTTKRTEDNCTTTVVFGETVNVATPTIALTPTPTPIPTPTHAPTLLSGHGSNTRTTYSHNSKTTRSWPIIYRNPQQSYEYEAPYAHSNAPAQRQYFQTNNFHHLYQPVPTTVSVPIPATAIVPFKQNCYSNQFAQSIIYSSSNEDLINEQSGSAGPSGGGANYNQTTCYYFSPSRHNSIYDHPSSVVSNTLQYDTGCNNATVESLRRNSSLLLCNSNCAKILQQEKRHDSITVNNASGAVVDTPTSINSAMDGVSGTGGSTCCSSLCMGPPPVLFLFITLLMTTSATAMLCAAIMSEHWEIVTWDRVSLDRYTNRSGMQLEWLLDEKVAMLKPDKRADHRFRRDTIFLVPMHGGIWTLCIDLPLGDLQELRRNRKFPRGAPACVNYLAGSMENAQGEEQRNDWQHSESQTTLQPHLRMQNLSISCSLVCLIILGSAALVGAFGVCQRQISAILITGVMYLLAALFALFTLMIIHFKRQQGRPMLDSDYDGTVDGIVARPGGVAIMAKPLLGARIFLTSWSLDLGWGGVVLCAITSVLWILLSKIMRYNPFSALMI